MSGSLQTYSVKEWVVFGRNKFKPPFRVSDELINEARVVHVVKGNSRLYSANHYTNLKPGDTVIMKSDNFINDWLENPDDGLNEVVAFQLSSDFLQYLYSNQLPAWFKTKKVDSVNPVITIDQNKLLEPYFNGLEAYWDQPDFISEDIVLAKVRELLSILVTGDNSGEVQKILGNLFQANEYEFQEVIRKNLFENLSIEELAFLTGQSLSSFKRKFTTIFGTSPVKYINARRLDQAQTMLASSDLSISEIAFSCGFNDIGYFSKTFKAYYKISPSEFRNSASG